MKLINKLSFCANRLVAFVSEVKRNSNKITLVITFVLFQAIVLGAFSMVSAQDDDDDAYFDSSAIFKASDDSSTAITGDENSNIHKLSINKQTSDLMVGAQHIFGTDAFDGAAERSEELGLEESQRAGLLNTVDGEVTAMLYSPPSVAIPQHLARQWVPGSAENSSFSAYAQGEGYNHLKNELKLEGIWQIFRDISYAGFVIIVVIAGFMIMFRSKIGGQITVGVMNTLPAVLLGILMTTFSFAIVGFVLDLSKLMLLIVGNMLDSSLGSGGFSTVELSGPIDLAYQAFMGTAGLDARAGGFLGGPLLKSLMIPGLNTITGPITLILAIILGLAALFAGIKLYITLVMSYIKIILDLVLGPIYILFGSLPGKSSAIFGWLKRIVSNALVFPVVFFIINLARYLGNSDGVDISAVNDFFMSGNSGAVADPILKMKGIIVIAGYFLASGAPGIISEALDTGDSKGAMGAVEGAKKAMSKIPLVGGMFG